MNNAHSCFAHLLGFILLLVGFCILPLHIQDPLNDNIRLDPNGYETIPWDRPGFLNVRWEEDRFVVLSVVLMTGGALLLTVGGNVRREASRDDESEEE